MKKYKFIYRDKFKNEIAVITRYYGNIQEAKIYRDELLATCNNEDVKSILVKRLYYYPKK